jgi:hypothetical protein
MRHWTKLLQLQLLRVVCSSVGRRRLSRQQQQLLLQGQVTQGWLR